MIKTAGFRIIPKGAIKVADRKSDAVAYVYGEPSRPAMRVYYGKQSTPVAAFYYKDAAQREQAIARYFASRQASLAYKAERAAKRKAVERKIEVGSFFYTSWGYDQTNIDWYRVTKLIGKTMLEVVEVTSVDVSTPDAVSMTGKSIPGEYTRGAPFKVRANGEGFKVKGRYYAYPWDGQPKNWTAYA